MQSLMFQYFVTSCKLQMTLALVLFYICYIKCPEAAISTEIKSNTRSCPMILSTIFYISLEAFKSQLLPI